MGTINMRLVRNIVAALLGSAYAAKKVSHREKTGFANPNAPLMVKQDNAFWQYMVDGVDPFDDEEDDFRYAGPQGGLSMQGLMDSGGTEYCRDLFGKKGEKAPRPGDKYYDLLAQRWKQCKALAAIMVKKREQCRQWMLAVLFTDPKVKARGNLTPRQQQRRKYCSAIVRVADPYAPKRRRGGKRKKRRRGRGKKKKRRPHAGGGMGVWGK